MVTVPTIAAGAQYEGLKRYYTLESRPSLMDGSWAAVPGCIDIVSTGQTLVHTNLTGDTNMFYRGTVRLAP